MFKFNLGDSVKHKITGFTGIVVGRSDWYNGCVRYVVMSRKLQDGKPHEVNFDEAELTKQGKAMPPKASGKVTGGPRRTEATRGNDMPRHGMQM